ncbi:MAG: phage head closure protein [Thermodesulfovibrionia bacterium]|nr:phage head closure protein [Thermodesulfovibrionia bacterium]
MKQALSVHFEVQEKTETNDGRGGTALAWVTKFRLNGKMKALRGYEQIRALALEDKVTHRIKTWYDARLTTAHRLKFGSTYYNIRFIENINMRNVQMQITVDEVP